MNTEIMKPSTMADGKTAEADAAASVVVVGRQFTVSSPVDFTITCARGFLSPNDHYKVIDIDGDVVFKVKGFCFSSRSLLLDANGTPLLTMKPKTFSWHATWRVFKGESTDPDDLLFTVRKSKIFQCNDNFDVILATDSYRAAPCDFKITGRSKNRIISIAESDKLIAQMHRKTAFFAKDKLEVTVNPNVDYVFILSLIVILENIKARRRRHRSHTAATARGRYNLT